jgi:hypothetical protein
MMNSIPTEGEAFGTGLGLEAVQVVVVVVIKSVKFDSIAKTTQVNQEETNG